MLRSVLAVVVTLGYSFVVSLALIKIVDMVVGARVPEEDEQSGLDLSQHAEAGYTFVEVGTLTEHTRS